MSENRKWVLARRPAAEPSVGDFRLETAPLPQQVAPGEVLCRTRYLSLDPYMRWRMNDAKSYARPVGLGEVMVGTTVGEVIRSESPDYKPGDMVVGAGGWQDYAVLPAAGLRKVDAAAASAPLSTMLGALGMPGFTAYAGLMKIGQPKAGETVVVAAATGPVGAMVGQLARLQGCRTVAIAGGPEKCAYALEVLKFDVALDHRDPALKEKLAAASPQGIDIYFENVGGKVWDAVIPLLNDFARIPVCGLISQYNLGNAADGDTPMTALMRDVLVKRLLLRGFIVTDFAAYRDEFLEYATPLVANGTLQVREDIVDGLEKAPEAFIGLLQGRNFGKLIVRFA